MRNIEFTTGEYYHVYNRGVEKRAITAEGYDSKRFIQSIRELNAIEPIGTIYENSFRNDRKNINSLVDIVCFCLNLNHYHILLRQKEDRGTEKFMHRLGTAYTKYFNNKYKRVGPLFQGRFKAKHVTDNDYLLHLSAYINLNNRAHKGYTTSTQNLDRSSWPEYVSSSPGFCKKDIVLGQFKNPEEYAKSAEETLELIIKHKQDNVDEFE
jgi:REP element-mobilizing transposase RayT